MNWPYLFSRFQNCSINLLFRDFYYFQHLFFFNILQFLHPAGSGRTPLLSRQGDPTHFPFLNSLQLLQELWTATPLHVSGSPGFPEHLFFFISLQSRQPFRRGSVRPFFRVLNLLIWASWAIWADQLDKLKFFRKALSSARSARSAQPAQLSSTSSAQLAQLS